jgi:hypothetical protein
MALVNNNLKNIKKIIISKVSILQFELQLFKKLETLALMIVCMYVFRRIKKN